MYGQGNYAPEFRQGSHTPMPPFQQHPVAPPPPPLQLGLSASQPSTIQQAPPSISRHGGYSSPFVYQLAPSPPVQQGPPFHVANSGMLNSSRPSHLPPPPPLPQQIHGSIPVAHQYPTARQTSQWTQNMHHIPTPVPSPLGPSPAGPSHPEMFQPTIPSRLLPPLPSQGQPSYRVPNHLQQPGSVQGTQQIPRLPPPPPTSSFFTPAAFGSFVHSAHQNSNESNMGPTPPPPPPMPFSPPPLPPSPPPPTSPLPAIGALSSTLHVADSDLLHHSESGRASNLAGSEVMASDFVDNIVVATQIREDAPTYDDYKNPEGRTSYDEGSHLDEDLSNVEGTKLDLYPPPLKPAEEKVVQKIEVLCHFIAKNGPSFEDMARQKESGNPEFEFLFGGEPGSEAAVAHEYFEWMKNKCILACKLQHGQSNSALRPSDIDTLTQTNSLMHTGASHSSSDSDMDMEDDITQPDAEQQVCNSFEGLNGEAVMIPKEFQERSHTPQNAVEHSLDKDDIYGSLGLAEQEKEYSSQSKVSAAAAGSSENFPGELIKGASPFRLLQDYASDDSSDDDVKPCVDDVSPVIASRSATAGGTSLHADMGSNLQSDPGLKSLSNSDMAFSESVVACYLSVPPNAPDIFPESQRTSMEANVTSIAAVKVEERIRNNDENEESIDNVVYPEDLQPIDDALDGLHDTAPESGKSLCHKEDVKYKTNLPKFDEFGRLVREGASDSDSDGSRYTGRRGKRERSWSRSRSPDDRRRRRRRSPQRRKEKRNRSRSWSPKKRRSRSRSPSYWHGGESGGDKVRRDKGQLPQCFDFLRGRCHRGAFCRYMHHDSDNSNGTRRYRSKHQYVEVPSVSRTSDLGEEVEKAPPRRSVRDQDMPGSSFDALKDGSMDREKLLVPVHEAAPTMLSGQEDKSVVIDVAKSEKSREVTEIVHETRDVKEEILEPTTKLHVKGNCMEIVETAQPVDGSPSCLLTDAGAPKSLGDTSHGIASSPENLVIPQSQVNPSLPALQNSYHQTPDVDGSSTSGSSLVQTSTTFQNQLPVSAPHLNMISPIQSYPDHHSQLPPPLPSLSQGTSAPPPPQPRGEVRQPTSSFSSHYIPTEHCPPNQALSQNQHTYFTVPPNSSWSLPPPPPLPPRPPFVDSSTVTSATAMQGTPWLQFQENQLPPRSDSSSQMFVRPYPPQLPLHSQVAEFEHHSYSLMKEQEPSRPSSQMGDFRPNPLPMGNPMSQPFGGTGPVGERFSSFPVHGLSPSIAQGNVYHQPVPSSSDSTARIIQSFPGDNLASDEFSTSFQNYSQLRAFHGLQVQRSQAEGLTGNLGDYRDIHSTMPRYADLIERKQLSNLSDFGGSRISRHYNPYASTFVQPLTSKISKFSSDEFKQEQDRPCINLFDASYSLSHAPVDGQVVGSLGSRHTTSSPKVARAADLPRPDNDQYDPLFDSIEPSSNSSKKFDHGQRRETTLRLSSSRKPLDVEENKKQKEVEAVTETSIKSENDECGETADAEVGDVDNVSASNPLDEGDTAVGEIEIDQIKTTGKSKKSNDSRSMKLFKVAVANFVKEELKPSWRQGNMSKEAFKTIVKKTVEKVSGAMKNHHVPKSQAKINRYIDSSQRKLTKLVKGYVHKYAEG